VRLPFGDVEELQSVGGGQTSSFVELVANLAAGPGTYCGWRLWRCSGRRSVAGESSSARALCVPITMNQSCSLGISRGPTSTKFGFISTSGSFFTLKHAGNSRSLSFRTLAAIRRSLSYAARSRFDLRTAGCVTYRVSSAASCQRSESGHLLQRQVAACAD